jgi:hypothetical protein
MITAYLQFGKATWPPSPMQTVEVPVKESWLWWQEKGLSYTATGYGRKIPSTYMVKWKGRWRRVYVACYSNSGTAYIGDWLATVDIQAS